MALDPVVLFFILGLTAGLMRAEMRLPSAIYEFLSVILLIAIGLKGGIELSKQPFTALLPDISLVLVMGFLLPLLKFRFHTMPIWYLKQLYFCQFGFPSFVNHSLFCQFGSF